MADAVATNNGAQPNIEKTSPPSCHAPASTSVGRQHEHAREPTKRPVLNGANARHDNTPSAYGQALAPSCCDCGSCCPDCLDCACADDSRCNGACAEPRVKKASRPVQDGADDQSYRQHGGDD